MKKNVFFLLVFFTGNVFAQITFNSAGFKIPVSPDSIHGIELTNVSTLGLPSTGANQTWNYSAIQVAGNIPYSFAYSPYDGNSNYANANATFFYNGRLGPLVISGSRNYFRKDSTGYYNLGFENKANSYGVGAISGNQSDSLYILKYANNVNAPKLKFPMTFGTSWDGSYKSITNFQLSVAAFFLNKTPGTLEQYVSSKDEVVGWGSITIGGNGYNNVPALLVKREFKQIDSVFLSGSPAPSTLLQAFGITQGAVQQHDVYEFYVYDGVEAKMRSAFYLETNESKSDVVFASFDKSTYKSASISNFVKNESIKMYPNPTIGSKSLFLESKKQFDNETEICVIGMDGRKMIELSSNFSAGTMEIPVQDLPVGIYFVQLRNNNGALIYADKFVKE